MTNMNTAQGEREDLLDRVVPPPPPTWHLVVLVVAMLVVAALAAIGRDVGVVAPSFQLGAVSPYQVTAQGSHGLAFSFTVQSSRILPVTFEGIDASASGLSGPRITYEMNSAAVGLPIHLSQSQQVEVRITWPQVDCTLITTGERYDLPIHYRSELGWNATISVSMPWTEQNDFSPRQLGVGWPAGVSWSACGRPAKDAPSFDPS
jgi:hypothetical protein